MKHTLFIAVASIVFATGVQHATAQEYCGGINNAGSCPVGTSCQNINPENGEGRCLPDASATIPPLPSATKVVPVPSSEPAPSSAFVPLAPIDGLTKEGVVDSKTLSDFLRNLYRFLVGIAATLAVIEIVIGGLQYATQDIPSQKSDGKQRIWNAIFGLILVLSPVLVFSLINPAILDLSIQLRELDTKPRVVAPSKIPQQTQGTEPQSVPIGTCSSGDCSSEIRTCYNRFSGVSTSAKPEITCQRRDGSLNRGGLRNERVDSTESSGTDRYACPSGETVVVNCTFENNPIGA